MSTSATTPNNSDNPFDTPLPSEVKDHQQASAQTVASGGNPFDEPLPSEKAEAQFKANAAQDASNTRQMLVSGLTGMPTPNMTAAERASFEKGKAAGAVSVPIVAAAATGATAAPEVVPEIVNKAKAVAEWAKANPIKSVAIAKIADELGVHPFDLMHKVVKYGKNLFGVEETTK